MYVIEAGGADRGGGGELEFEARNCGEIPVEGNGYCNEE